MDQAFLTDRTVAAGILREEAEKQGFVRAGIALAQEPPRFGNFLEWIEEGHHAGMNYLARSAAVRGRPQDLLPQARSILCLAYPHPAGSPEALDGARLARYAAGPDYHQVLRERAERLVAASTLRLGSFGYRVCVDSTPVAERSLAAGAGLGWIGKNGCLIDPEHGSFLLLAEIVTDLDLPPDEPIAERCGSCVKCLEACPTDAFIAPGLLDARRCLSYWTIEHRGPIPDAIKENIGNHIFGCDVCQEVCPWNKPLLLSQRCAAADARPAPTRKQWLKMGKGEWKRRYGATALNRAGRRGVQRNAAASAGSLRDATPADLLTGASGAADAGLADAAHWAGRRVSGLTR